jgi:hypothetical protein
MNINNQNITRAIRKATDLDHVKVYRGEGVCRFYSDDEATAEILSSLDLPPVYVCRIDHLDLDQWVAEFQDGINSDYKRSLIK